MSEEDTKPNKVTEPTWTVQEFFRDIERESRAFILYWEGKQKVNGALYRKKQTEKEWWQSYLRYQASKHT